MTIKQERAARLIHNILSALIMNEVVDPALEEVTVTGVKVDREIEYAEVYVYALSDDKQAVLAGLRRASGFLRRELAARTSFRKTPELHFHWDASIAQGERIEHLLAKLNIPPEEQAGPDPEQDSAEQDGEDADGLG